VVLCSEGLICVVIRERILHFTRVNQQSSLVHQSSQLLCFLFCLFLIFDFLLAPKAVAANSTRAVRGADGDTNDDRAQVFSYVTRTPANVSMVVAQGLDPEAFVVTTTGTLAVGVGVTLPAYSLTTVRWVGGVK
jgi:hypothetical protein